MRRRSLLGSVPAFALLSDGTHIMRSSGGSLNAGTVVVPPGTPTISVGSPTSSSIGIVITQGSGSNPSTYAIQHSLNGTTGWAPVASAG